MVIHPRKLITDLVENQSCNGHQMVAGHRSGMKTSEWTTANAYATFAAETNYTAIVNNNGAEVLQTTNKRFNYIVIIHYHSSSDS